MLRFYHSVLALLFALVLATPALAQRAEGDWTGAIDIPGNTLAIEVTLEETGGAWTGTISIPAQNLTGYALGGIRAEGDSVFFQMDGIPGTPRFRGVLKENDAVLAGDFLQGQGRLTFSLTRAEVASQQTAAQAQDALAGFDSLVVAAMDEWHVPGLGLAIVRGGEILYEKGYGLRDVAAGTPVTPTTRFAIGSASKAFTAASLALLVDDGALDWNTPVIEYLPDFRMYDPVATEEMTALDLVVHRSGLPRHDLLWYSTPFTRADLFSRLQYLEPTKPFRSAWQYQNLMFMAAGYLAGTLNGSTWEQLVQQRLFDPLGMTGASFTIDALTATDDYATGYAGGRDSVELMPYHPLDAIGPAGSINASARDMAQWVKLHLSDGEMNGQRILSKGSLDFLHLPQVFIGPRGSKGSPYLLYAPGWFAEVYQGHRMLQHGGNIDGFSALVGFLPDDDLGLVILTNKNGTPLPAALMQTAFDRILDLEKTDWVAAIRPQGDGEDDEEEDAASEESERVTGTTPSHALADFAGVYEHPAYGQVTIQAKNDSLHIAYYTLDAPLAHWHYDTFAIEGGVFENTKLTFHTDASGRVETMTLPFEPALDPLVFTRATREATPAELARYAGTYQLSTQRLTVAVQGENLALTVPGQPTYTLEPTSQAHLFSLSTLSGYRARFDLEEGRVVRMVLLQPNGTFTAERVEE